eukprot:COSAG04_NODE_12133_length_668_cov_1.165202_1_plen_111_part_10
MAATIAESKESLQRDFVQQSNTAMRETAESMCQVAAVTVEPGETQAATRAKAPRGALSSRAKGERKLLATPTPVVLEEPDADQRAISMQNGRSWVKKRNLGQKKRNLARNT